VGEDADISVLAEVLHVCISSRVRARTVIIKKATREHARAIQLVVRDPLT
jgi:hypothetical protein